MRISVRSLKSTCLLADEHGVMFRRSRAMSARPIYHRSAVPPTSVLTSWTRDGPSPSRQDDGYDALNRWVSIGTPRKVLTIPLAPNMGKGKRVAFYLRVSTGS
jgi:hypothetical protein